MKTNAWMSWIAAGAIAVLVVVTPILGAEPDAIVIGCPLPLGTSYGLNGMRGATLAVEQINVDGGIVLQGEKHPLKLEVVETQDLDPATSQKDVLAGIESLIREKKVDVLIGGPAYSNHGIALMDIIAQNNVVHIVSTGCYSPQWIKKFETDPKKYRKSFRISGNIPWFTQEMRDLLAFLQKKFGFRKMFILVQDETVCREAAQIVKDAASQDGWIVADVEIAPSDTTDFTPYLERCKKSGAQVLFLWSYTPNSSYLFEQWKKMELPALPMGFVETAEDPDFWKKTGGKCAYSVITLSEAGVTLSDVTPLSKAFYKAYEKRWGVPPRSTGSAASYEAVYLLKDAIERADSLSPDKLVPALEQADLPVVRGTIRFDKNHQCMFGYDPKTAILGNWAQWQRGKRVTVWPPAAQTGKLKLPPWFQWFWLKAR